MKLKDEPFENNEEACYRTSIGRIYYSVFLIIRDKLYSMGKRYEIKQIRSFGEHEKIIIYLQTRMGPIELKLGGLLKKLKDLRVDCDYELGMEIQVNKVEDAIFFFKSIKNILIQDLNWISTN
ncbi:hypothetical protein KAT24_00110 [Candidatus Pacearchaeota archaeon]|nr:hypothetical protein [Candidatus Pacearchaeota archaeon]